MGYRDDKEIASLIRRIQKDLQHSKKVQTKSLEELVAELIERYRLNAMARKFEGKTWLQIHSPSRRNPAVGLYISADGSSFLDLDFAGKPTIMAFAEACSTIGEARLRRICERAGKQPPPRIGRVGEDLLAAFRQFEKEDGAAQPTSAQRSRGTRRRGNFRKKTKRSRIQ